MEGEALSLSLIHLERCIRDRIKNLRNAIETAPLMPSGAVVVIDTTVKLESWTQDCLLYTSRGV
nr:hypothetical protein [Pseudomonas sp. HS-2]